MDIGSLKRVKTAIVGCGAVSDIFFQNFTQKFRIIELVKCCSRGMKSAEEKARQYGIKAGTFEEILKDPEIELIVNITPAAQHYSIIKASLEAGKHVYSEKVITPDFHQTKELLEYARSKGLYFGSEPDHFLGSAWQCAREYIDAGLIGDVTSMFVSLSQNIGTVSEHLRFVSEPAGSIGYDYGIYPLTQMVAAAGPAAEVCGILTTQKPERIHKELNSPGFGKTYTYNNEDIVSASVLFENGIIGNIHMNGNSLLEAPELFRIHGTLGVLSMPAASRFSGDIQLYRQGSFESVPVLPCHGLDHDSRGAGAAELAWAIRLGRKPRADVSLGLHCQEILQGIQTSFETRQFYKLTTTCEKPAPLPKGFRNLIGPPPWFSFSEEGAFVF